MVSGIVRALATGPQPKPIVIGCYGTSRFQHKASAISTTRSQPKPKAIGTSRFQPTAIS